MTEILPGPWAEFSDVWDTLYLGGKEWPGIAKVTVTRANKWDEKKAKGSNNADRTYTGTEPAKIKIELRFWNAADQYDVLVSECLPIVEPEDEKKRKDPLDISHAVTQARKVAKVTVDSVSGPDDNGDQTWTFTIEASEYKAPTAVSTSGGKGTGGAMTCAQMQQTYSWFAKELQRLGALALQYRQQVQAAELLAVFDPGALAAAQGLERANAAQIAGNSAGLAKVSAEMARKGCPLPPSSGGGVGP